MGFGQPQLLVRTSCSLPSLVPRPSVQHWKAGSGLGTRLLSASKARLLQYCCTWDTEQNVGGCNDQVDVTAALEFHTLKVYLKFCNNPKTERNPTQWLLSSQAPPSYAKKGTLGLVRTWSMVSFFVCVPAMSIYVPWTNSRSMCFACATMNPLLHCVVYTGCDLLHFLAFFW